MTNSSAPRGAGRPRRAPRPSVATLEAEHRAEVARYANTIDLLTEQLHTAERAADGDLDLAESLHQLERAMINDPGWRRFATIAEQEFSPEGLVQIRAICRLYGLKNPLIKRGLALVAMYVHGQGYEIRGRATGKPEPGRPRRQQDVNAVIDRFVANRANRRAVFGQQAAIENDNALGTDGEVFIAHYTRPQTGWVQVRTFAADEIAEVITNPDDRQEPWFYRRRWQREYLDAAGQRHYEQQDLLYPDIDYRPRRRPAKYAGIDVDWWAPVLHVHVNRPKNWLRGIPDVYAALDWARAYKEFLEQWSGLMKSLAKFAWQLTADGRQKSQAKAALAAAGTTTNPIGEPNAIGGTAITPPGATLEAIPKSGAVIDSDSGRPIATMVASALNLPVTMLLADPGQTGNRATAETLDRPTELGMGNRQQLWRDVWLQSCAYVIREAVRAPRGPLQGRIRRDETTDLETVELAGDTDDTVDVDFPPLKDVDPLQVISSVVQAASTQTMPPDLVLRLLLNALGVRDPESILDRLVDQDGNFRWPSSPATAAAVAGQQPGTPGGADPAAAGDPTGGPDGQPENIPAATPGTGGPVDAGGSAPVPTDGVEGRMADADFGLGGGDGAQEPAGPLPPAGVRMPPGTFDPAFFTLDGADLTDGDEPDGVDVDSGGLDDDQEVAGMDSTTPEPAATAAAEPIPVDVAARMADADFGLGGSKPPADDGSNLPAGDKPAPGVFDPEFFKI